MAAVTGLTQVMSRLNAEIIQIKGASLAGLIRASILIRQDMEATPPLVPIDLGNLRASWFVTTSVGGVADGAGATFEGKNAGVMATEHTAAISEGKAMAKTVTHGPGLVMGFSANYGEFVHESVGKKFKRPGSGAKFLQSAVDRNMGEILLIIQNSIKIVK